MKSDFLTFPSTNNSFQVGFSFLDFTFFTQPSILTPSAIKRLSSHQNSPRHIIIFTRVSLETLKLFAFLFLSGVKNRPLSCLWFLPNCYRLNFLLLRKSSTFQPATALISQLPNLNSTLPTFPPCDGYTSFQPGQAHTHPHPRHRPHADHDHGYDADADQSMWWTRFHWAAVSRAPKLFHSVKVIHHLLRYYIRFHRIDLFVR